jgi:anti-sigma B factor antagonist
VEGLVPTRHDESVSGSDQAGDAGKRATVTVRHLTDAIVVTADGEIDMATAPELDNAVRQSLTERPGTLVIDLRRARFFSSAGIAVLVTAHRGSAEVALRVVADDSIVLRPLELTGLIDDLAIHPTIESALAG